VLALVRIEALKPLIPIVILCFILTFSGRAFAAPNQPTGKVRTISDISSIPHQVLKRSISPKFYKSLLISPIEGYVVVRGQVNRTTHLSGLRVIHSELGGAYDSLALERAKAMTISGYYSTDKIIQTGNVLVTLLIYKIADGTAALSFAQVDEPGGDQNNTTAAPSSRSGKATANGPRSNPWIAFTVRA
jgi:hypothetical protein